MYCISSTLLLLSFYATSANAYCSAFGNPDVSNVSRAEMLKTIEHSDNLMKTSEFNFTRKRTATNCPAYDYVDSFIGSGGAGFGYGSINPSAQVPFGALRLGPDTTSNFFDNNLRHFSGYNYLDRYIRGFSHTVS